MKVVINKCFGGFGLSPLAVKRYWELKGRPCFLFTKDIRAGLHSAYIPATVEAAGKDLMFYAFDIPNPNDVLPSEENWHDMSLEQRQQHDARYESHSLEGGRELSRHDPDLVRIVEELGEAADGKFANLEIVEIPDGVDYVVEEYDGREHIAEAHRTWG